eukprot:3202766-Amphidinium_carterae.1
MSELNPWGDSHFRTLLMHALTERLEWSETIKSFVAVQLPCVRVYYQHPGFSSAPTPDVLEARLQNHDKARIAVQETSRACGLHESSLSTTDFWYHPSSCTNVCAIRHGPSICTVRRSPDHTTKGSESSCKPAAAGFADRQETHNNRTVKVELSVGADI